jgi:hypothetical protein
MRDVHAILATYSGLPTVVAAEKRPVVAADRDAADRPLGGVVVDGQIAILGIAVSAVQLWRV